MQNIVTSSLPHATQRRPFSPLGGTQEICLFLAAPPVGVFCIRVCTARAPPPTFLLFIGINRSVRAAFFTSGGARFNSVGRSRLIMRYALAALRSLLPHYFKPLARILVIKKVDATRAGALASVQA